MKDATRKATILAEEAGLSLGEIIEITELSQPVRLRKPQDDPMEDLEDFDIHDVGWGLMASRVNSDDGDHYTKLTSRRSVGVVQVRVRFDVTQS